MVGKIVEFIYDNFIEISVCMILFVLCCAFVCLPLSIILDYKIKSRALDIYEKEGIEIHIEDVNKLFD